MWRKTGAKRIKGAYPSYFPITSGFLSMMVDMKKSEPGIIMWLSPKNPNNFCNCSDTVEKGTLSLRLSSYQILIFETITFVEH
jgi:hypothetical protein